LVAAAALLYPEHLAARGVLQRCTKDHLTFQQSCNPVLVTSTNTDATFDEATAIAATSLAPCQWLSAVNRTLRGTAIHWRPTTQTRRVWVRRLWPICFTYVQCSDLRCRTLPFFWVLEAGTDGCKNDCDWRSTLWQDDSIRRSLS
jgi:hypothetical protein